MIHMKNVRKVAVSLGLLASVGLLTACSQASVSQKAIPKSEPIQTLVGSSAGHTNQLETVSVEGSESASEAVVTSLPASEPVATEAASQPQEEVPAQAVSYATTFDLNALSAGDYSSIAGSWANASGQVFTVTAGGKVIFGDAADDNSYHQIVSASLSPQGSIEGSIGFMSNGERQGGAHMSIVPAGVANINGVTSEIDHIEIGHDISSAYPENQFFRQ